MPRKRANLTTEQVENAFARTEPTVPPYDLKYRRHTYRVRDATHHWYKDLAAENEVGLNEVIRHALAWFRREHEAGRAPLPLETITVTKTRLTE